MSSINNFFKRLKERPSLYFILLALITAFSAIEAYNPIIKKYGSFSHVIEENYVEKLSGWLVNAGDFLTSGSKTVYYILFAFLILLLFSALSALFFSGYANKLLLSVEDKKKAKGEFVKGVTQKFFKTLLYIYSAIILSTAFFFMIIYAAVPVFFRINQLTEGNADVIFSALIMGLLTVVVIFFALVFYFMYFSYILPAISGMKKGAVLAGFRMTNTYVWYLLPKTLLFMLGDAVIRSVLFIIHYGHSSFELSIIVLCVTAFLRSVLYFVYLYFTFNTFVAMREDLYPEYGEENVEQENVNNTENIVQPQKKTETSTVPTHLPKAEVEKETPLKKATISQQEKQKQYSINFEEDDEEEELQLERFSRYSKSKKTEHNEDIAKDENSNDEQFVSERVKLSGSTRRNRVVSKPLEDNKRVMPKVETKRQADEEDEYDDSF